MVAVAARGVEVPGLVLCAPALQRSLRAGLDQDLTPPCETVVVHGTHDEVVPPELSRDFARADGVTLHEVDDDHRLAAAGLPVSLAAVTRLSGKVGA